MFYTHVAFNIAGLLPVFGAFGAAVGFLVAFDPGLQGRDFPRSQSSGTQINHGFLYIGAAIFFGVLAGIRKSISTQNTDGPARKD